MGTLNQDPETCSRCGRDVGDSPSFSFHLPEAEEWAGRTVKCLPCALLHKPMLKRSAIASVVVGTILTALNQGDLLLSGQWNSALYWKIPLTYCVPFLVATYGALTNSQRKKTPRPEGGRGVACRKPDKKPSRIS